MRLSQAKSMIFGALMATNLIVPVMTDSSSTTNIKDCLDPSKVDYNHDYFPEKAILQHSKQWNITYHNTYKIITNKASNKSYLLYQCGTEVPSSEKIAGKHHLHIQVPLQNKVALSQTTQIPHLEHLGARRQVKAYIGSSSYISSPCLNYMIDESLIDVIPQSELDDYLQQNKDILVIGGPFGNASAPNTFTLSESTEEHSRDIYEWIKAIGALFNAEAKATRIFDGSVERFQCATDIAVEVETERGTEATVVWAYYSDWANGWDVATCDPKFNYYCSYAQHCKANLLHSNEGSISKYGSAYMNDTEFIQFAKDAEVLLYMADNWEKTYNVTTKKAILDQLASVKAEKVYDYMGSGPNSWFEQRLAEYGMCDILFIGSRKSPSLFMMFYIYYWILYFLFVQHALEKKIILSTILMKISFYIFSWTERIDVVLQDFCDVVGTSKADSKHVRKWFRHVFTEPIGSLGTCDSKTIDVEWKSRATECPQKTSSSGHLSLFWIFACLMPWALW